MPLLELSTYTPYEIPAMNVFVREIINEFWKAHRYFLSLECMYKDEWGSLSISTSQIVLCEMIEVYIFRVWTVDLFYLGSRLRLYQCAHVCVYWLACRCANASIKVIHRSDKFSSHLILFCKPQLKLKIRAKRVRQHSSKFSARWARVSHLV